MARISTRIWDLGSDERGMIRDAIKDDLGSWGLLKGRRRSELAAAFVQLREMILDWRSVEEACESMEFLARQRIQAEPDDSEARAYSRINPIYC